MPLGPLLVLAVIAAIVIVGMVVRHHRAMAHHAAEVEQAFETHLLEQARVAARLAIVGSPDPVRRIGTLTLFEDRLEDAYSRTTIPLDAIVSVGTPEKLSFDENGETVRGARQLQVCWTERDGAEPRIVRWDLRDAEAWAGTIATLRRRRAGSPVR